MFLHQSWQPGERFFERLDLVITNMILPKMTGIDLYQEILKIRLGIPIVLSSGIRESDMD
jgi:DNA-binding NtrC family response regulator